MDSTPRRALAAAGSAALAAALWWTSGAADLSRPPALDDGAVSRLWDKAVAARDEGRVDFGLRAVERLLASSPHEPRYLSFEAAALELQHRPLDAAHAWELYAESAPFPTEACPMMGVDYENAGFPALGLDAHRRCLALDPSNADLLLYLALGLERAGRDDEAQPFLDKVLVINPAYVDAILAEARIQLRRGDLDAADRFIRSSMSPGVEPSPDIRLTAALIELARGRPARARQLLAPAIKAKPNYEDLYRVRLRAENAMGDSGAAAQTRAILAELERGAGAER